MEQKFGINSMELGLLRDFCEQEGHVVTYSKGEQMEREGDPSQWFGYVTEGCFKYTVRGISDGKEHITWFSFEGEFVGDYPVCLDGHPSLTTIEAMIRKGWNCVVLLANICSARLVLVTLISIVPLRESDTNCFFIDVLVSWSTSTCRTLPRS